VQNAASSDADAVFLDLEDAVPPSEKEQALESAVTALTTLDWGRKWVSVRLNAFDSRSIKTEVKRLGGLPRLDALIIPKAEMVADVREIAGWIAQASKERHKPAAMELLIETAMGMVNVDALAAAH